MGRRIVFIMLAFITFSCENKVDESSDKVEENTIAIEEATVLVENKTILCFGNSLTAGYGLEKEQAYPAILQNRLDSLGYDYSVVNAGVSGETTSGGLGRLDWMLKQKVDVFILELGANDGLRGIPTKETRKNLSAIIDQVKTKYPEVKVLLAGMKIPPSMGSAYGDEFEAIFPSLAEEKQVALIPFFLEGIAGKPELNQADGIHPTKEGIYIVVDNVMAVLSSILER